MTPTEPTTDTTTDTLETTPQPEAETAHDHAGHDHSHEGHTHGPSLNPACTREIEVEAPAEEVSKAFRTILKRFQKQARIPGFRAGKVPESLIRSKFATDIRQEVLENIVPQRFREALAAQSITPVSQPQVIDLHLNEGDPLRFKAAFEVLPEFDIHGYDAVTIEKPDTELTDAEFDAEVARIRDSRSTMEPVAEDRALADGDWAEINFKGNFKDAEAAAEQPINGDNVTVEVGGENTLPAFNEALRGSKPGQELQFEVDYPLDFGEKRLAGKTVSYDVAVTGIKKKILPELNDDFAKEMGDYESYEEFATKLREHAAGSKKQQMENQAKEKLVDDLVAKYSFPVPESLVQQQIDARLDRGLRALAAQGMKAEDMRKLDFERLRAAQRDSALNEVKASLILDKIATAENVEISEDDVDRELMMLSLQTREPLESLRDRLTQEGGLNRIREQLRREKTGNLLYEKLAS
ncbi:MAG: trigger factor [Acidobacteriaceae bacterium]